MRKFKKSTYIIWGVITFVALAAYIVPLICFSAL